MGAIAGPNIIILMLTAMEHDLQARINTKQDTITLMSMQSIFFGNKKAALYQQLSQVDYEKQRAQYERITALIAQQEQKERMIQQLEKTIEMEMQNLQNQLKMVQQRKEAQQKILDQNMKGAFSYGHG